MSKLISISGSQFATSSKRRKTLRDNTLDVFNAEIWAREALIALEGNLVLGNLAYRDFTPQVAKFGDVVSVARPGTFNAKRKTSLCQAVEIQDGTADSFQLALDQFLYVTFKICDGEENRQLVDLVDTLMVPAVQALSTKVDLVLAGQNVRFWKNSAGHLGGINGTNVMDYLIETNETMINNKVPFNASRELMITPKTLSALLSTDILVSSERAGNSNTLRNGEVGRAMGFDFFTSQSQPSISKNSQLTVTAAINGPLSAGATVLTVDAAGAFTVGQWIKVNGDDVPQRVTAVSISSNAGTITIAAPGLKRDVADNAIVTSVVAGLVNKASGYSGPTTSPRRLGYAGYIVTDGWSTTVPQLGQPVSFGAGTEIYTVIEVSSTDNTGAALTSGSFWILVDRPLESSIADNATINLAPAGQYNLALTKNALAAAFRPLPKPRVGALASVISDNGLSLRVTITYDGIQQAHIVTVDLLMGVGVYDPHLAAVMFG